MFERNDDVLYICYDNEGYMNTGVQRSSATPPAARTATTPAIGPEPGNVFGTGKSVPKIAVAHDIPYVATATVADLHDLERKVTKAMSIHGARYIQINVPCPLGWGAPRTTRSGWRGWRSRCGLFPIFEAEHGRVTACAQDPPAEAGERISEAAAPLCASVQGRRRGPARRPPAGDLRPPTSPNTACCEDAEP